MHKKKKCFTGLILIAAGVLAALTGTFFVLRLPADMFEYVVPAPALPADTPAEDAAEGLKDVLGEYEWSAALRTQDAKVSASGDGTRQDAVLYAAGEGYFDLHHETLAAGRYITGEDLRGRKKVAVINRRCAFSLYPGSDPVGRPLFCNGMRLEIVGVTREGFRPGETAEYMVWIPMTLASPDGQKSATLEIRVRSGSQANNTILKNLLKQWTAGGTVHEFSRLRLKALMPLWLIGAAAGFLLLKAAVRKATEAGKNRVLAYRQKLKTSYPGQMKGRLAGTALLLVCFGALLLACVYGYLSYLMIPLYVFTDWIPEALVDPQAIAATAGNLLRGAASSRVYYTCDATAYRLYASWIAAGSLLFLSGAAARAFSCRNH